MGAIRPTSTPATSLPSGNRPALSAEIPAGWRQANVRLSTAAAAQKFFNARDFVAYTKTHSNSFTTEAQMKELLSLPSVKKDKVGFAREVILKDTGVAFSISGRALDTLVSEVNKKDRALAGELRQAFAPPSWGPAPAVVGGKGGKAGGADGVGGKASVNAAPAFGGAKATGGNGKANVDAVPAWGRTDVPVFNGTKGGK